jgi:hypothetical protein
VEANLSVVVGHRGRISFTPAVGVGLRGGCFTSSSQKEEETSGEAVQCLVMNFHVLFPNEILPPVFKYLVFWT